MKAPDFVVIKGKLPSLNEYIEAERTNRYKAAKMKKEAEELIFWQIKQMKPIKSKIRIKFTWYEEKSAEIRIMFDLPQSLSSTQCRNAESCLMTTQHGLTDSTAMTTCTAEGKAF